MLSNKQIKGRQIKWIYFLIISGILILSQKTAISQTDIGSWTSLSLNKRYKNTSFLLKPIARLNEDLSNYNNFSIDFIVRHKVASHWQFAFLERYWWLKNGVNRNFLFFDIGYRFKANEKIILSQYLRWHIAQDIEINDPNFIRWHPSLNIMSSTRFKPYIGIEFFWRLDGVNKLQRTRAKIGGGYSISKKILLTLRLWREDFINQANTRTDYIFELNFDYKL